MKHCSALLFFCFLLLDAQAQVVINEVLFTSPTRIELKNLGTQSQDVSSYILCSFPTYNGIGGLTVVSGDLNIPPGGLLVLEGHNFSPADDECGLYTGTPYNDPDNIIDYVEWGSSGHARSGTAAMAGIWSTGDFVDGLAGAASLEYDGEGELSMDWAVSTENTQGEENSNADLPCDASATAVGNQSICEGESATFQVVLTGIAPWTLTYSLNGVMQEPVTTSDSPFAWSLSEAGTYSLNGVSDATCEGTAIGTVQVNVNPLPTATLMGNGIVCAGDSNPSIEVALTGNGPWQLAYQLDGVPQGSVTIDESPGQIPVSVPGMYNLISVSDAQCDGSASGSLQVSFIEVNGGDLSQAGSAAAIYTCVDDGETDLFQFDTDNVAGDVDQLIITDENGEILGLPEGNAIDFEGGDAGICQVWNIGYATGLTGLSVGNTVPDDLMGCYSLSNPIEVVRETGLDCTTGLAELEGFRLSLYPNPVQDELSFTWPGQASDLLIRIYTAAGSVVDSRAIRSAGLNRVDVSQLPAGIYLVEIRHEGSVIGQGRFIK